MRSFHCGNKCSSIKCCLPSTLAWQECHIGSAQQTCAQMSACIDRLSPIVMLSVLTGEYVAAEKIEAAYKKNSLVDQIWVYGNSLESTLVAIVVPAGRHAGLSADMLTARADARCAYSEHCKVK